VNKEQLMELKMAGEDKILKENMPHCHFLHHKSRKLAINCPRYSMAP
jgi:hypothetical protein